MVIRRGTSSLGCLVMLLVSAAVVYFGVNVGETAWKFYEYQDRMKQEVRFAAHRSDAVIRRRVSDFADSLDLPEGAKNVRVRRGDHALYIWAEYYVHLELPGFVREVHLHPQAVGTF